MNIPYKPELPKNPPSIIIIGAGGIVRDAHLPAYKKAGFEVFGITNRSMARAQELAEVYGIPHVFTSLTEAVEHAPNNVIYDLTLMPDQFVDALNKLPDGAAVLIQKPMGDYFEQTSEIYAVCKRKKLKAAVNCQLRYAPFVLAARYLIDEGFIGQVYDMEVRLTTHTPWGIFPNVVNHPRLEIQMHSIHYIDLIRSFLGNPDGVYAKTLKHPSKNYASTRSTLILDYGDALHAVINTNHDHEFGLHNQESFIKWEGTKGAIKAKMGLLLDYPKGVPDCFEYCLKVPGEAPVWQQLELVGSWFPDAFIGTMSALMMFANGECNILPTGIDDVIHTMAVIEAAYKSNHTHGIRPDADAFNLK
ncbi:Gfo/Idh/MocA family protein [Mucilaginibacter terrae]|uniref:Gfo/Idh/MocA family protein n=1 Tax=Mucilaginibacter terrae TaxID=1955052 RepID=UPI0036320017